jgi:hypothetical protein
VGIFAWGELMSGNDKFYTPKQYRELKIKHQRKYGFGFDLPKKNESFSAKEKAAIREAEYQETDGYREKFKNLKKIHNFNFKLPRNIAKLTGAQKSAITKKYNELAPELKEINEGRYTAINIRIQTGKNKGKRKVSKTEQAYFRSTNKVIIIPEGDMGIKSVKKIVKSLQRRKVPIPDLLKQPLIIGKTVGKNFGQHSLFIPAPAWLPENLDLLPYYLYVLQKQFPDFMYRLGESNDMAFHTFRTADWGYLKATTEFIRDEIGDHEYDITGVYAITGRNESFDPLIYGYNEDQILDEIIHNLDNE